MRLSPRHIIRTVKKILRRERIPRARLSVVFVTDRKIRSLNKKYLKRDRATDVLAFDLKNPSLEFSVALEGEIIISTDSVIQNAEAYRVSPRQELTLCLVHGILHLMGFDDHGAAKTARMRKKEQVLLRYLAA